MYKADAPVDLQGMNPEQISYASDFMNKESTKDFTIITGDEYKVRVHKTILALKSPVFGAMIEYVNE